VLEKNKCVKYVAGFSFSVGFFRSALVGNGSAMTSKG